MSVIIPAMAALPQNISESTAYRLLTDFKFYARHCLKIIDKDGNLVPFVLNEAQEIIDEAVNAQLREFGWVRLDGVKGRQQGFSTYVDGRFYWHASTKPNRTVSIISHEADSTYALFDKAKTFHANAPGPVQPSTEKSNRQELKFNNGSLYMLSTAGTGTAGRSRTAQYQHQSERAFMPNIDEIDSGVGQVVPLLPGTEVFRESTGNGMNHFYDNIKDDLAGRGVFRHVFIPWTVQKEYTSRPRGDFRLTQQELILKEKYNLTDGQLQWRRDKIVELKSERLFKQEYPFTLMEAFQTPDASFFDFEVLDRARDCKLQFVGMKPVIMGVDPARTGDRTVLVVRTPREIIKIEKYDYMDSMRLAGIVTTMIQRYGVDKCFIDYGLGYGTIDRLRELGYGDIVDGVHFGESADDEQYANKRAEMAFRFRDWLSDGEVKIPSDDDMIGDILAMPDFKQTSSGKLIFPTKDEIRKNYGRSPDILDAIMLTFARHVRSQEALKDPDQRYNVMNRKPQNTSSLSTLRYMRQNKRGMC